MKLHVACAVLGMATGALVGTAGELYVAPSGSDSTGDGTKSAPYQTIQHAVDNSASNDWIYVAGGTYNESVTTPTYRFFSGSWNSAFTARDLRNGRSVVVSASASSPCLLINPSNLSTMSGTNVVVGFTFTGGLVGVRSLSKGGSNDSSTFHHVLSQLIITNNVNGIDSKERTGGFPGFNVSSSLIADNSGHGFYQTADHGTQAYFSNCLFLRNGSGLCRDWKWATYVTCRNCAFVSNSIAINNSAAQYRDVTCYDTAFYGNGELSQFGVGLTAERNQWGSGVLQRWRLRLGSKTYCSNPRLATDGAPATDSPLRGTGADLSASGVTEDVYGTPWDGVYDIGCVKGAGTAARTLRDELWVSPSGSDANAGTDAAHPLKSVNAAMAMLAENGTCHLAAGTYAEEIAVYVSGARLLGESAETTFVQPPVSAIEKVGDKYVHWSFGVGVFAPNVVVSNLTARYAAAGFYTETATSAGATKIGCCNANDNVFGVIVSGGENTSALNVYSRMQVCRNAYYGMFIGTYANFVEMLLADNGDSALEDITSSNNYKGSLVAHCTFAGNGGWGVKNTGGGSYQGLIVFLNSIFANNAGGAIYSTLDGFAYSCCFHNNGSDGSTHFRTDTTSRTQVDARCFYADPLFRASVNRPYRVNRDSPCHGCATNLDTMAYEKIGRGSSRIMARADVSPDLLGTPVNFAKPTAIGCYQPIRRALVLTVK